MTEKSPTRSLQETIVETAIISATFLAMAGLVVMTSAGGLYGGQLAWEIAVGAGELLFNELGWVMSTYITVLLGFYAVSIGGQILGDQDSADATRRVMGFVAELMAAATVCLLAFIAAYCWQEPSRWAVFIVLIPAVSIILFLALHLGTFLVVKWDFQIIHAARAKEQAEEGLAGLLNRSTKNFWVVLIVNLVVIAGVAFAVILPLEPMDWTSTVQIVLFYLAIPSVLLAADILALHSAWTSSDRIERAAIGVVMPTFAYVIVALLFFLPATTLGMPLHMNVSLAILIVGTVVTSFWPFRLSHKWFVNWSMRGAVANLAYRSLEKSRVQANAKYRKLCAARAEPEPGIDTTRIHRLLHAWKVPADNS
ncbi:hypothetical protein E3T61_12050 [Cryobacterium lactosi]|uniref:Uncharacterized protein n=1 Tax=Cryobacterium lactosi TaxID=1259202 RepID=A0A4R9BPP6_9MICO|nr:hypothetical protein [Cryobacterium lactosi]TFD88559.1 hypothetical protein E3T61_12050 [Cryobacterium lactosi]